jgi:hypothetical protein
MPANPGTGHVPDDCYAIDPETGEVVGTRAVHVVLFNGWSSRAAGHAPWPAAGGRLPTQWRISSPPHPFEIREYEVIL